MRHTHPGTVTPGDDVPFSHVLLDDIPWACAPLDVEDLADLICEHPTVAAAQLHALTVIQRRMQALAHVAWLHASGIAATVDDLATCYDSLMLTHPSTYSSTDQACFADLASTDPPTVAVLFAAFPRDGACQ